MELSKNRIKRTEFSIISIGHYLFFGREKELMIFGWIGLAVRVIVDSITDNRIDCLD